MADSRLFRSFAGPLIAEACERNEEQAPAYARPPEQALAQMAATGCLNATFYATAGDHLNRVLGLTQTLSTDFIARTAIYSRERGHMKDMPALLVAVLAQRDVRLMERIFDRVIDSPRMLRTFVQILRSGVVGRKSFGSAPKRCVRRWLDQRTGAAIFAASVGEAPSLADIVKMVRPKPANEEREALYGYLIGKQVPAGQLPDVVRHFEAFKAGQATDLPDVPFQMLTSQALDTRAWQQIARQGSWQMTRMNLNTFARHGVFADAEVTDMVANRLRDPREISKARVLPYQLMAAALMTGEEVPAYVRHALEDAMELAIANVPVIDGRVFICPDVSGSMESPITGRRKGATTKVRCVDVAALITAAFLRQNPAAVVLPFNWNVVSHRLSARESVLANARELSALCHGGTNVSAPITGLNRGRTKGDLIVIVSDNQSWVDASEGGRGTKTMVEWNRFRSRNPQAKLVLLDLQPHATTQAYEREDVLNVGGFSDQVFEVIARFANHRLGPDHWVGEINAVAV